jgi:hypothetical protein
MFLKKGLLQNYRVQVKAMEDNLRQTEEETQVQREEIQPIENLIKTKILGLLLLIFTAFWAFLGIYNFITFGLDLVIILLLYVFSFIVGIALLMIKKRGTYHILLVLCGIILLLFYVFALAGLVFLEFF